MTEHQFINEFEATGRVVKVKPFGKNATLITLFIRNSNNRNMFPQFVCQNNILPESLSLRTFVTISGWTGNVPFKDQQMQKTRYRQRFIATSVESAKTLTELKFGVKGKFHPESYMRIYIKGQVIKIEEKNNWNEYCIRVDKQRVLTVGMKQSEHYPAVSVGNTIFCVCKVSTIVKNERRFENIQVTDLAVME